jgi:hypothetical protein
MKTKLPILLLLCATFFFLTGCYRKPVKINPRITPLSDYMSNDGKISIKIEGGKRPYSIMWSNNKTDTLITDLASGFYFISITDARGKTTVDTFEVTGPKWPVCVDIEGNSYKTAVIDTQTWMIENLRVTTNKAGKTIESFVSSDSASPAVNLGRLYSWETAMDSSIEGGSQGICPDGWHIPTDKEWSALSNFIENSPDRRIDTIINPLNLVYAGFYNGSLQNVGLSASFWTSTKANDNAWKRYFHKNLSKSFRYHEKQTNAISVRCVKNK